MPLKIVFLRPHDWSGLKPYTKVLLPPSRLEGRNAHFQEYPDLPFLAFSEKKTRKMTEKTRIFLRRCPPTILGKEWKTLKKTRNSLQEKTQGIRK